MGHCGSWHGSSCLCLAWSGEACRLGGTAELSLEDEGAMSLSFLPEGVNELSGPRASAVAVKVRQLCSQEACC